MHNLAQLVHKVTQMKPQAVAAGRVEYAQGVEIRPHQHMTWELVYILQGTIRCTIGDQVYEAQPGTVLVTPPKTVHVEVCPTAWACYYILVDVPVEHPWPRVYQDDANRTFEKLCSTLIPEIGGRAPDRHEMLALLLGQLDLLLRRTYAQRQLSPTERLVSDVERCIEERYMQRITTMDLANEVGVSPSYLRRQFLRLRGHTPTAYLQTLRVQHAIALTQNSSVALEAIATICGYDSASHMSRHVKRVTGKSPGAFRNAQLDVRT
jgi:AraC-like DNA-binding protein/mannose-6-phosphate isomerase-like protein (cupin superfamily)